MYAIRIMFTLLCAFLIAACSTAENPPTVPSATQAAQPSPTLPPTVEQAATVEQATAPVQSTAAPTSQAVPTMPAATATPEPAIDTRPLQLENPALQGDDVRAVQQRLADLGYTQVGTIDGIFGPQTGTAVRAFQQTNKLGVDGIVGPQTRSRLFDPAAARAVIPIVVHDYSDFLLGGVQGAVWLEGKEAAPLIAGGERYRVVGGTSAEATGGKPAPLEAICTDEYTVTLQPENLFPDFGIAVGGTWPLQPRTPRELAKDDRALEQLVTTFLQSKGIDQPDVNITDALQVDLDGDGTDEVVLVASRISEPNQDPTDAAAGDYSVVLVQKQQGGQPKLIEVGGNYFPQAGDFVAPNTFRLIAVLDLNGDGALELVVNSAYYEGAFTSAYQIERDAARAVLGTGCGV